MHRWRPSSVFLLLAVLLSLLAVPVSAASTDPVATIPVRPEGVWLRGEGESQVSVLFPGTDPAQLEGISVLAQVVEDPQQVRDQLEQHVGPVAQMYLMDISLMAGGQPIQPDGIVVVEMPIPDASWLEGQIAVYHISENGGVTNLQMELSEDGAKVRFVAEHFSYYALALHGEDKSPVEPTTPTEPTEPTETKVPLVPDAPEPERFSFLPVGIAVAVVIAAGVAVAPVLRKKRK